MAGLTLAALSSPALATPSILLESYAGQRPKDAGPYIKFLVSSLEQKAPLNGAALRQAIEVHLSSSPGPAREPKGIRGKVEDGRRLFIEGRFKEAIKLLEQAREALLGRTVAVASDQGLRTALHRALLFLTHAYLRTDQGSKATLRMTEVLRSFPDRELSLVDYAPELVSFYKKVRQQLGRLARGALQVSTTPKGCMVFVNERFVGMSPVRVPRLYPGRYRVYVGQPQVRGRVHRVLLTGGDYQLHLNFLLDRALVTEPWVGFRFEDQPARERNAVKYATVVGRALEAPTVLLLSMYRHQGNRALVGRAISPATGQVVRSALVSLEPAPPSIAHINALGQFLTAGKASSKLIVRIPRTRPSPRPEPAAPPSPLPGVLKWVAVGAAVAGLASGIALLAIHGQKTCSLPEGVLCPEKYDTLTAGAVLTAGGGLAAAAAGLLFYLDISPSKEARAAAVLAPWAGPGGAGLSALVRF